MTKSKSAASVKGQKANGTSRRGRSPRKLTKFRVVYRTWLRTGSGIRLHSEVEAVEVRNVRGDVVGGERPRMIPKSRRGGRTIFRACEMASARAGAGLDGSWFGGAR